MSYDIEELNQLNKDCTQFYKDREKLWYEYISHFNTCSRWNDGFHREHVGLEFEKNKDNLLISIAYRVINFKLRNPDFRLKGKTSRPMMKVMGEYLNRDGYKYFVIDNNEWNKSMFMVSK